MRAITLEHYDSIKRFLNNNGELSCENSFVNLLVWQKAYSNCFKILDDCFLLYSKSGNSYRYRLPFCDDFEYGFNKIIELNDGNLPVIWAQEGAKFDKFKSIYSDKYDFEEIRDAFDYIYKTEDLISLSGKKYHSKRNHIAKFSKNFNWEYKTIDKNLVPLVLKCAQKWYLENSERMDKYMSVEQEAVNTILNNMDILSAKGGAILVDGEVIAFTLGSPINEDVFDIHIEKALKDYSEAYTVINREFLKNELADFKFVNREDDMGLEGLRKAKLSYKPHILLKKYLCKPKVSADER